jgi:hypothetical protein
MEEISPAPTLPPPGDLPEGTEPAKDQSNRVIIALVAFGFVTLLILIAGTVFVLTSDTETTAKIRDVFIIFMALESLVVGVALIILMVQLATLINLLQNELKPMINSTNETVNTLRGTVVFLSENVTEPVIKLNSFLAGSKTFLDILWPGRGKR